jgi:HD-like signal output (HDOD) protein
MTAQPKNQSSVSQESFAFVQELARELSAGKIDIPAFPDVAARVRRVLADEFVSAKQVVQVVSSEPALAGKLLMIANSAAMNPNGPRITELKSAITRIGLNMVRSASLAFAVEQMRKAESFDALRRPLNALWERCVLLAAMSFVVAKRTATANPDQALLAGLMHGLGKLYILTRASKFQALFADQPTYLSIVRDWHSAIAKAILENWEMDEDIVVAINEFEDLDRVQSGSADLTDVLTAANLFVTYQQYPESLELNLQDVKACSRLRLDGPACEKIIRESGEEVASLRSALGA